MTCTTCPDKLDPMARAMGSDTCSACEFEAGHLVMLMDECEANDVRRGDVRKAAA